VSAPLDDLHDFYSPPPPPWTPQTIGWYVLFGIAGLLILWTAIYLIRRWFADRYRREALRELALLPPEQFSALLKRTALVAWPREEVASLSGEAWLQFLDESIRGDLFHRAPANRVEEIALSPAALSNEETRALRETVAEWIRRHHVQA
jgi:Domain of unknown function (DUF4381)